MDVAVMTDRQMAMQAGARDYLVWDQAGEALLQGRYWEELPL